MAKKVALITGANTGIGLAVAERLLVKHPGIHLVLACRNQTRAEEARLKLVSGCPGAKVDILLVNISSLESVYRAAKDIKQKYQRIDLLYLNAGIMPVSSVNWKNFSNGLFSRNVGHMFLTGHGLLKQEDGQTPEGLQKVFATNLFGHFVLVKELEDILGGSTGPSQIIWTSSSNAKRSAFQLADLQNTRGEEPYASSKYASDCTSVMLNEKLNKKNIYSHSTCPGLVMTNLTYGIMPSWIWFLLLPILWLIRLVAPNMNIYPEYGAEALVWLSDQPPEAMDPRIKYRSEVSFFGQRYVNKIQMGLEPELPEKVYDTLMDMAEELRPKFCH